MQGMGRWAQWPVSLFLSWVVHGYEEVPGHGVAAHGGVQGGHGVCVVGVALPGHEDAVGGPGYGGVVHALAVEAQHELAHIFVHFSFFQDNGEHENYLVHVFVRLAGGMGGVCQKEDAGEVVFCHVIIADMVAGQDVVCVGRHGFFQGGGGEELRYVFSML